MILYGEGAGEECLARIAVADRRNRAVVVPVGSGPVEVFSLFDGFPSRVGEVHGFVVIPVLVRHGFLANAPDVHYRAVLVDRQLGTYVGRFHEADIRSQAVPELVVIADLEVLQQGAVYLRGRVVIAGGCIRLLKGKGCPDSFS
jgi:hypothetical protein